MWTNGTSGLLTAESLNSLKIAVSNLSEEQALLVLSSKNLTKAQTEQVLVEAGIIASNDKISASLLQRKLIGSMLTKEQQKELLTSLGLIDGQTFPSSANMVSMLASSATSHCRTMSEPN